MKIIILSSVLAIMSTLAIAADEHTYLCMTNVGCKNNINGMLTTKFKEKFPANKWNIFVLTSVSYFNDGSGAGTATVGVVPARKDNLVILPENRIGYVEYQQSVGDSRTSGNFERNLIKKAILDMMTQCDTKPNCSIDKRF